MAFQKGDTIDDYILDTPLGSGSFAEVWRVRDGFNQAWAMKIFAAQTGLDSYGREQFREEFEKTRNLQHQNVLHCITIGEHDNRPYLILPLGRSNLMAILRERLQKRRQLSAAAGEVPPLFSEEELAQVLADVAEGLAYLQQNGIVHQDIKPENILLLEEKGQSRYVIADFGVSTQLRTTILRQTHILHKSSEGLSKGYASPEQLGGFVSKKSDIFSLGAMMFELATGKLPFEEAHLGPGQAIAAGSPPPTLEGPYSQRFKKLVALCLEKDPTHRPDAAQLLSWSDGYLNRRFWSDGVDSLSLSQQRRRPARLPLKWLALGAALLIAIAGLWLTWRWKQGQERARFGKLAEIAFRAGDIKNAAAWLEKAVDHGGRGDAVLEAKKVLVNDLRTRYARVGVFSADGLAPVMNAGGAWGFVRDNGQEAVAPQYEQVTAFVNGRAAVFSRGKCGYVDRQGGPATNPGGLIFTECEAPGANSASVRKSKKAPLETIRF